MFEGFEGNSSLPLLMWIVGLIIPDSLLTFDNYFNTRASVTQLYFCSSMLIACLSDGTHTLWVKLSTYLSILWFIGMINPEATINFGLETRWAITGLCIFMGLLMGAIWGGLQGISLAFSG